MLKFKDCIIHVLYWTETMTIIGCHDGTDLESVVVP